MSAQKSNRADDTLLIEISSENFNWILRYANEASPVYFRLKNSIRNRGRYYYYSLRPR